MKEQKLGKVSHYYGHLGVAIIDLENPIEVGDKLRFMGHTTDFEQVADSVEHDEKPVEMMPSGHSVGVKVDKKVREHDDVFKVVG